MTREELIEVILEAYRGGYPPHDPNKGKAEFVGYVGGRAIGMTKGGKRVDLGSPTDRKKKKARQ